MNCKTKAFIVGVGWGVGLILALAALIGILLGLFALGDTIGINVAAIVSVLGFGAMFLLAARVGYEHHLGKCKEH